MSAQEEPCSKSARAGRARGERRCSAALSVRRLARPPGRRHRRSQGAGTISATGCASPSHVAATNATIDRARRSPARQTSRSSRCRSRAERQLVVRGLGPVLRGAAANACTLHDRSAAFPAFSTPPSRSSTDTTGPSLGTPTVTLSTVNDRTVTVPLDGERAAERGRMHDRRRRRRRRAPRSTSHTMTLPEGGAYDPRARHRHRRQPRLRSPTDGQLPHHRHRRSSSGPADVSNDKNPTFAFSTLTGLTFDCSARQRRARRRAAPRAATTAAARTLRTSPRARTRSASARATAASSTAVPIVLHLGRRHRRADGRAQRVRPGRGRAAGGQPRDVHLLRRRGEHVRVPARRRRLRALRLRHRAREPDRRRAPLRGPRDRRRRQHRRRRRAQLVVVRRSPTAPARSAQGVQRTPSRSSSPLAFFATAKTEDDEVHDASGQERPAQLHRQRHAARARAARPA